MKNAEWKVNTKTTTETDRYAEIDGAFVMITSPRYGRTTWAWSISIKAPVEISVRGFAPTEDAATARAMECLDDVRALAAKAGA